LYGPTSPVGLHVAYTRGSVVLALCFVTLPFVVRTVQPVLLELDTEMEEAARSLGARQTTVFRRIVLPNLLPGILSGAVLALARALGEIGSLVLIAGNIPGHTQVVSVYVLNQIESGDPSGAAAVAVVLLGASFVLLLAVGAPRFFVTRYERGYAARTARGGAWLPPGDPSRAARDDLLPHLRERSEAGLGRPFRSQHGACLQDHVDRDGDRRAGEHGLRRPLRACDRAPPLPRQGAAQRVHRPAARALPGRGRPRPLPSLRPHRLVRNLVRGSRDPG